MNSLHKITQRNMFKITGNNKQFEKATVCYIVLLYLDGTPHGLLNRNIKCNKPVYIKLQTILHFPVC